MRTILFTFLLATCTFANAGEKEGSHLRVATFCCDLTPPLGSPLRHNPLETVENSLLAKGIVLDDGHARYILCSVDWCLTNYSTHLSFRRKMAQARHRRREQNLRIRQHTLPFDNPETVA